MPELPEVQTIVTTLAPCVTGATIQQVVLGRQDIVTPCGCDVCAMLAGRQILGVSRRAKRIIFRLDSGQKFYIHLGMSGHLGIFPPEAPIPKHTHLRLVLASPSPGTPGEGRGEGLLELRFRDPRRFGGIFFPDDCDEGLGPEPLTIAARQLAARLAKTKRPIKSALLDQRLIAGLGNIYVDESLFTARIHPLTRSDQLTPAQATSLTKAIKRVLNKAIHHRGSTLRDYRDAQGNEGGFQKIHQVYGREGKPCPRCHTPIKRITLTGRSTHFCPKCQPRRAPHIGK